MRFAMDAPVTNNPLALSGNPKSFRIQPVTCRSTSTGMWSRPPKFAFNPAANISATTPTGVPAP